MSIKMVALAVATILVIPPATSALDLAWCDRRPVFKEGWDRGYYVWREGDTWHVRWTTMGKMQTFTGTILAEGGELGDLKRIDVEKETKVIRSGRPGRVWVGPYGRVHRRPGSAAVVATKEQDKIEKDGDHKIVWRARTDADIDGFDFEVEEDVSELRFVLEIGGQSRPGDVEVGESNRQPPHNPFVVPLR
jgi:hypothetical protein